MPINNGIIEMYCAAGGGDSGGVTAQIFYDSTVAFDPPNQAIIEQGNPPAACLVTNTTGGTATVVVTGPTADQTVQVPPGTTRLRLAQLQAQGIRTRADLAGFSLSAP